ncbi:hypothetical protein [Sphingomonas sp. NIC1]|uniref:hypothetical protein n=1 Tax=Sphingomonas sp. NIC1 TaxID=1961362 RepID=UPI000A4A5310|nr:hypothetical protein [Sphingomonas sp. NIC1]
MNAISVTGRPSIHASTLASDFAFQYKSVGQVRVADLVQMEAQRVKIVDGGKLVIPAAMRRELGITTGTPFSSMWTMASCEYVPFLKHLNVLAPSCASMCPKASAWPMS